MTRRAAASGVSAFGLAHRSVRSGRGMTGADAAAEIGRSAAFISLIETGRTPVTTAAATALVEPCLLSLEERCRLARGWAVSGIEGDDVRYDLQPGSDTGYRAAAMLSMFASDMSDAGWRGILDIIRNDVLNRDVRAAA